MRSIRSLSFLSASLVALTLGGAASAAPGLITKRGPFPAEGAAEASSHPLLERAARKVVGDQLELSRGLSFGQAKVVELSRGDRVVKLRQLHKGLPVVHRGVAVTFSGGVARLVSARLESELPDDVTPDVSSELAAAVAEERTGLPVVSDQIALALWPTPDGVRLVWALAGGDPRDPVPASHGGRREVGEIIYVYNSVLDLNQVAGVPVEPDQVTGPRGRDAARRGGGDDAAERAREGAQLHRSEDREEPSTSWASSSTCTRAICSRRRSRTRTATSSSRPPRTTTPRTPSRRCRSSTTRTWRTTCSAAGSPTLDVNNGVPLAVVSNLRIPQGFRHASIWSRSRTRTCRWSRSRTRSSRRRTRSSPRCSGSRRGAVVRPGAGPRLLVRRRRGLSRARARGRQRDDQARGDAAHGRVRRQPQRRAA
jgi:hypothetical protein